MIYILLILVVIVNVLLLVLLLILVISKLLKQLNHIVLILGRAASRFRCLFLLFILLGSLHVEICLVDVIILLCVCGKVVDGGVWIIMILNLYVRAIGTILSIFIGVRGLLVWFGFGAEDKSLLRAWWAKDSVVCEEIVEVFAHVGDFS